MDVKIREGLTFDDVLLEPRNAGVVRSGVFLLSKLTKKISIDIPVIAAAMDRVSGPEMAIALGKLGGLAVLHRNCSVAEQVAMVKKVKKAKVLVAAAVGPADTERALALDKAGADIIVVDTAHGHNLRALKSAREIKRKIRAQLIYGNIGTAEGAREAAKFADAIKIGIGPGSICTTRVVAGVGVPQLTAVMDCVSEAKKKNVPVVADGGMRYSGDIVKALAAGASTVMLGSMLAGTKEAPGKLIKIKGELYKEYRGMGSYGAMQGGKSTDRYQQKNSKVLVPEGVEAVIKYKGPVADVLAQITGGLQTGMSYIGANSISEMPKMARFIRITNAGLKESHPHSILISKKAPNY